MFLFLISRFFKYGPYLFITFFFCLAGKIGIAIPGLTLADKSG
jgi:hypothetical protein